MLRRCGLFLSQTVRFSLVSMIVLGISLFLLSGMARGEVTPAPVEDLTRYASEIVIGKVVEVSEKTGEFWTQPGTHKTFEFFKATIDVSSVIKGDPTTRRLQVYYLTIGDTFGELVLGRPSLFFINDGLGLEPPWNKSTVMSTTGDVPIDGEFVLTDRIKGQPKRQPLKEFIDKIRVLIKGEKRELSEAGSLLDLTLRKR